MRRLLLVFVALVPGLLPAQQSGDGKPSRQGDAGTATSQQADTTRQPSSEVIEQDDDLPLWTRPERAAARLVLVPVTVTTNGRDPILDLEITDFQLRVDRTPYPISTFDRPFRGASALPGQREASKSAPAEAGAPAARPTEDDADDAAPGTPPTADAGGRPSGLGKQPPVYIAVVLDLYMTGPGGINSAIHAVKTFLEGELPESSQVALYVVSHGRMQGITPFTTDTGLLLRDLETVRNNKLLRDTWVTDEATRQEDVRSLVFPANEAAVKSYSAEQSLRVQHVLNSLQSLAAGMARLRGRKDVIFISDGIREQAGLNYAGSISQTTVTAPNTLAGHTINMRDAFFYAARVFKEAGVTLSPVSMVGLYNPTSRDQDGQGELMGSLQFLAKATGGRRPAPLNDFVGEVEAAMHHSSVTYILGFRPPPADLPGTVHRIQVRVFRPRTTVSARSEYIDGFDGFDQGTLLAAAALLPDQFKALRLNTRARTFPGPDGQTEIMVQTELSTRDLGWLPGSAGRRRSGLALTGVLRAPNGERTELFRSEYPLDLETARAPEKIVLQERADVVLTPGSDIVVAAIDRISGNVGSSQATVPVLPTVGAATRVSAPAVLVPVQGVYLLSPVGEPLIGFHGQGSLFIPVPRSSLEPGPAVAISRLDGLPADATVRFCIELDGESCVTAGLRSYQRPAAGASLAGGAGSPAGESATASDPSSGEESPARSRDAGGNVMGSAAKAGPESDTGATPAAAATGAGTAAAGSGPALDSSGTWTAMVALDAEVARNAHAIRVEVLDAEGSPLRLSRK